MREGEGKPMPRDVFARIENGKVVLSHDRSGADALAAGHWPGMKDGRQGWRVNFGEETLRQASGVSEQRAGLEVQGVVELKGSTIQKDTQIPVVFRSYARPDGIIWFAFPLDEEKWKIEDEEEEEP